MTLPPYVRLPSERIPILAIHAGCGVRVLGNERGCGVTQLKQEDLWYIEEVPVEDSPGIAVA